MSSEDKNKGEERKIEEGQEKKKHSHSETENKGTPAQEDARAPEKIIETHEKSNSRYFIAAIFIILAAAAFMHFNPGNSSLLANASAESAEVQAASVADKKVTLEFYVMSQCPYGLQVENAIAPVLDELGDAVEFSLEFIARETEDGFTSLHGQNEVDGNIIQLCAAKYNPDKYMDMIVCQNKNAGAIPGNWEDCAKNTALDMESIRACYEGEEGKELLSASIKKAESVGATGSPTMYLNGKPYNGGRDPLSFKRALCANLEGNPACKGLEPVKVNLIVLNDKDCSSCDTAELLEITRQLFPGVVIEEIDTSSSEGKAMIKELGISVVPAYLFGKELEETASWKANPNLQGAFEKKGDAYKLLDSVTGASHFVNEEARAAHYESIGVNLGDNRPQIDFFLMSFCPYGDLAEEAIEPVYQLLKEKADFNPRYVFAGQVGSFSSLHGPQELNLGIRELCVDKYMGTGKWFEFAMAINEECNYQNADSCWEGVADKLGLDIEKIKTCEKDEGDALATEEVRLREILRVSGSPTVFIDGEAYNGQRTTNGYKAALCAAFETAPPECEENIPSQTTASSGGCS